MQRRKRCNHAATGITTVFAGFCAIAVTRASIARTAAKTSPSQPFRPPKRRLGRRKSRSGGPRRAPNAEKVRAGHANFSKSARTGQTERKSAHPERLKSAEVMKHPSPRVVTSERICLEILVYIVGNFENSTRRNQILLVNFQKIEKSCVCL